MQHDNIDEINISNIRNIVFWGFAEAFEKELNILERVGAFQVYYAQSLEDFEKLLQVHMIHMIIIDVLHDLDDVKALIQFFYKYNFNHLPLVLAMEDEVVDQRCEYFTHGISHFYVKGQEDYFLDTLYRLDQELTHKEGLKNMSIAVLDDDGLQLRIMEDMLSRNQIYNVDFYQTPKALLKSDKLYDVYLIDLILPEIDGEIVMLEMRKRSDTAIIIGISSIEKKSTIARVLSIGANDFFSKPVNEQVFMAKLHSNTRVLMLLKENELKKKILQELAIKDGLTGLYNHKHLHEILETNTKYAMRYNKPLTLIMLDIDDFKYVNDTYGHPFGDVVLMKVSNLLKETVRACDIVGRYGGEEFIIILPETTSEEAYNLSERIRLGVSGLTFKGDVKVTLSGGISQLRTSSEQLIHDADQRLYRSKQLGKNKMTTQVVT